MTMFNDEALGARNTSTAQLAHAAQKAREQLLADEEAARRQRDGLLADREREIFANLMWLSDNDQQLEASAEERERIAREIAQRQALSEEAHRLAIGQAPTPQASQPEPPTAPAEPAPPAQTPQADVPPDTGVKAAFDYYHGDVMVGRELKHDVDLFDASKSTGPIVRWVWDLGAPFSDFTRTTPKLPLSLPRERTAHKRDVRLTVFDADGQKDSCTSTITVPAADGSTALPPRVDPTDVVEDEPAPAYDATRVEPPRHSPHYPFNWDWPVWIAAACGAFVGGWFLLWLFGNLWTHMFHIHRIHPIGYKVLVLCDVLWDITLVVAAGLFIGWIASHILKPRQVRS